MEDSVSRFYAISVERSFVWSSALEHSLLLDQGFPATRIYSRSTMLADPELAPLLAAYDGLDDSAYRLWEIDADAELLGSLADEVEAFLRERSER